MDNKIEKTIDYYTFKSKDILDFINSNKNLTVEQNVQTS